MTDRDIATGPLGMIQAYVNTAELEDGREEFTSGVTLSEWLVARGLMEAGRPAEDADLKHAMAVREAIRGVIGANSGAPVYPVDIATLNGAVAASRLRARFGSDGTTRLEPEAGGVEGALGRIVAATFAAIGGGGAPGSGSAGPAAMKAVTPSKDDWTRLKLCDSHSCRRVFYDSSRNHSSRWCKMASCGNRQKAKRFRERARAI